MREIRKPVLCKCGNSFFELYKQDKRRFTVVCGRCNRHHTIIHLDGDEHILLRDDFPDTPNPWREEVEATIPNP